MPAKVEAKKKGSPGSRPKIWEADPGQITVQTNQQVEFKAPGEAWLCFLNKDKRPFNENPIHFHKTITLTVTNGVDQETYPYIFYMPSTKGGPDHYVEWKSPPEIIIDDSGGGS